MKFFIVEEDLFYKRWGWLVQLNYTYDWRHGREHWHNKQAPIDIAYMNDIMNARANGHYTLRGNVFYFERLKDVFDFRIMFDEHIKTIKQSKEALTRKWRV